MRLLQQTVGVAILSLASRALAADYHVSKSGSDAAPGTSAQPWLTISKATSELKPGDTCTVHAGTYRERLDPARGGSSEAARIVYRAAPGEQVYLKGSEQIDGWTSDGSLWKAVVANSQFGDFNPYSTKISGSYLTYGGDYHLGEVYLEGEPFSEVLDKGGAGTTPKTWYAEVGADSTTIWMNSGNVDPTGHLVEINVRKYVIAPSKTGLAYLTFDGFNVLHGATNWAPPDARPQEGMIMSNWGLKWVIERNHIADSKSVCIASGLAANDGNDGIDQVGNHLILDNTIQRCGQAGIAGSHGMSASTIKGNLIEDINPQKHFGGYESAGIKIHTAIDVVIADNIIRKVHSPNNGASHAGIWLDWQSQGSRISGNLLYDLEQSVLELEMDHGPTLIDNNIFVGGGHDIWDVSESSVFVHNLFVDTSYTVQSADSRSANFFNPHTSQTAGAQTHTSADDHFLNNIYIGTGPSGISEAPGFICDYNVAYKGASLTSWGDSHSISKPTFDPNFKITSQDTSATVTFKTDSAPRDVGCLLVTRDSIGLSAVTKQGIENHDGSPITIDSDILGVMRSSSHPTAGPFETLTAGSDNTFMVSAGASVTGSGSGGPAMGASGGSPMGTSGGSPMGTSGGSGGSAGSSPGSSLAGGNSTSPAGPPSTSNTAAGTNDGSGCGCQVAGDRRHPAGWLLPLPLFALWPALRRRRKRALSAARASWRTAL